MTDTNKIISEKNRLRKEILKALKSQSKNEVLRHSKVIKERLFELEEFKKARCVVFYVSMAGEVDTHEMIDEGIKMGKVVGVPVMATEERSLIVSQVTDRIKQLEEGPYGIHQPKASEVKPLPCDTVDLILVPGVAFDANGCRLGRGKGYYDRFLRDLPRGIHTIGLCFTFQVVESIPVLPHDIPVMMLVTN